MSHLFPREIWEEIFQRLTLKSLVKCTSVCKAWKSLITDIAFISAQLSYIAQANNGNDSLFLLFHRRKWKPKQRYYEYEEFYSLYSDNQLTDHISILKFPPGHPYEFGSTVVGTCNGLVCFADYSVLDKAIVVIMNPSIRKYVALPKPILTLRSFKQYDGEQVMFGFGFDSRNKDFKVVRLVARYRKQVAPQVEVYSLTAGSWRSITNRAPSFQIFHGAEHQMFVNGVLHWVVYRKWNGQLHDFILSFDVVEETFGELTLPQCLKESPSCVSILAGGSSLALVHTKYLEFDEIFSIWVMKEYDVVDSWILLFSFDSRHYGGISKPLALRSSGEVVLLTKKGRAVILLDPKRESVKKLGCRKYFVDFVGNHVESLFLINRENNVLTY